MADAAFVVDNGLAIITNRIIGAGTEPKYICWGTGATGAAATDTTIQTNAAETATTAVTGTGTRVKTNTANDTYQVVGTVTCAGSGKTITEVSLIDSAIVAGANTFFHGTFTGIALSVNDAIEFTLKAVFNQSA